MSRMRAGLLVQMAVLVLVAVVPATSAAAAPTWNHQAVEIPPPADAEAGFPDAKLGAVSCGAPGNCSAFGIYVADGFEHAALVVSKSGGTWHPAQRIALPPGAEDPFFVSLYRPVGAISCASAGDCSAVGAAQVDGNFVPMVVSETNGSWHTAEAPPLPPGSESGNLLVVSCAAAGDCTAVGSYAPAGQESRPLVATETDGTWGDSVGLELPSGAPATAGANFVQVSCPTADSCAAVGRVNGSEEETIVSAQSLESWQRPQTLALPAGATRFYGNSIACAAAGECVIGGAYEESGGNRVAAVAAESAGSWGPVTALSLPPDAASEDVGESVGIEDVACPVVGDCTALGSYIDNAETERPFSARMTDGTWATAEALAEPGSPDPEFLAHTIAFSGLDCLAPGSCAAVGAAYFRSVAFVMDGGSWGTGGLPVRLPPNTQSEEAGGFESMACGGVSSCAAVGSYSDQEGNSRMLALDSEPSSVEPPVENPPAEEHGGGGGGSERPSGESPPSDERGGSPPSSSPAQLPAISNAAGPDSPKPKTTPKRKAPKPLKCRKGFKKQRVHGKVRCVKVRRKRHGH